MIYSRNLKVAKDAAKLIASKHITRFHSQNALFIFIEDIKEPWIKNSYYSSSRRKSKLPAYAGHANYNPSINYLIEKGILTKSRGSYRISFTVNKENLTNFLQTK